MSKVARYAQYLSDQDLFFSRPPATIGGRGRRKQIRSQQIGAVAKELGEAQGLPASLFSANSIKRAHVTCLREAGLNPAEAASVTQHRSVASNEHYLSALRKGNVGVLASLGNASIASYTTSELQQNVDIFQRRGNQSDPSPRAEAAGESDSGRPASGDQSTTDRRSLRPRRARPL